MNKLQEVVAIVALIIAFGLGYGLRNSMVSNVASSTDQTTQVKDNHTVVTVTTTKDKDGGTKIVKTIDSNIRSNTTENKQSSVPVGPASKYNISALAGYDLSHPRSLTPLYGVSVTKQVLGPITVGAFGLTNGVLGVSLGVNF